MHKTTVIRVVFVAAACLLAAAVIFVVADARAVKVRASTERIGLNVDIAGTNEGRDYTYAAPVATTPSTRNYKLTWASAGTSCSIGSGTSTFAAKMLWTAFDGEVQFAFTLPDLGTITNTTLTGSGASANITAQNTNYLVSWKPTAPKAGFNELGGVDYAIRFKTKPGTVPHSLSFTISDNMGVTFLLQPSLKTEWTVGQLLPDGTTVASVTDTDVVDSLGVTVVNRPDYVVNSVAVYATGKAGDLIALGGKNYRAGKVGHLYRLRAVGNNGASAWLDWSVSGTTLTLTDTTGFLTTATYPVTLMPAGDTFGYTTAGGTEFSVSSASIRRYTATGAAGTLTAVSTYIRKNAGDAFQGALYLASDGSALTPRGAAGAIPVADDWAVSNVASGPTISAVSYFICAFVNESCYMHYDNGGATNAYGRLAGTYPTWPDSITSWDDQATVKLSQYATYSTTSYDITNAPASKAMGNLDQSSSSYAKGSAPSNPVQDSECTFTLTSTGSAATDVDIHGHNSTGGAGMTLTSSAPGANQFRITAYKSGDNPASGIVVTTSDQEFKDNLAASGNFKWDFKFELGTATVTNQQTTTLTLTGRAHS